MQKTKTAPAAENLTKAEKKAARRTPERKAARRKKARKIVLIALGVLLALIGIAAAISAIGNAANMKKIQGFAPVVYEDRLTPGEDAFGNVSFTADRELKIVQLTDVHIGGGFLSLKKDAMALNAVAAMVTAEKPDLVIVTGDIAYPVPFQAGTLNNKAPAKLFAALMERLGVYWTVCFGNHDTEAYSYYNREQIGAFYSSGDYPHCLFRAGPAEVDGVGNQIISVRNSAGDYTRLLYLFDSHAYLKDDPLGVRWRYDNVHPNQIVWYEETLSQYAAAGKTGEAPPSLAFLHIPLREYKTAWFEYLDNGMRDTENVTYRYGVARNSRRVVYCGVGDDELFETMLARGSTDGVFCGHDHYNFFSLEYKGIRLTYGRSVDYLAMPGIYKVGSQRGCTVITLSPDGSFDCSEESYYQEKYASAYPKESVTMQEIETGKGIEG